MPTIQECRRLIESVLERDKLGTHTFEDVVAAVDTGAAQFWPGTSSVVVTEILVYPRKKVLSFWLAAGKLAELEAMAPPILAWAKAQGCTAAAFVGRRGWERTFLARTGWKPTLVHFGKTL